MMNFICRLTSYALIALTLSIGPAAAEVAKVVPLQGTIDPSDFVQFEPRPGVTLNTLVVKPEGKPDAAVLLFAGNDGNLDLTESGGFVNLKRMSGNFLIRTHSDLVLENLVVVIVDSPSDNKDMRGGYRHTAQHAHEVQMIVAWAKTKFDAPVWLNGTSRGTESVANAAWRLGDAVDGIVLSASVTETNAKGEDIAFLPLDKVVVPALILHHNDDDCRVTPPGGAERIKDRLENAPTVAVRMFDGPPGRGDPCKARSVHGFANIEIDVIDATVAFIKAHGTR